MTKKKILIFSLAYFPKHVGGAEIAIQEITDRISDIEFHLITLGFDSNVPRESHEGNVHVYRVGFGKPGAELAHTFTFAFFVSKILFIPLAAWKATRLHKSVHFDGAWAMMSYMLFPLIFMRMFGMRIPYALTLQEGDPFEHVFERWYVALFRPLLSYGFKQATVISTISTFLSGWARKMGFTGPLYVIPNAVDTVHFSAVYPPRMIDEVRDSLNKKMGDVFLITTSRLVEKNAVDDVIRALPLLPQNVSFVILGTGPLEAKLVALAKELHVTDRVRFCGHVNHEDMPKYLQACDIFVRPSRSEGMGNSFVEAMAAGIPVIATQEGGIADIVFDEKRNPDSPVTGWVVDRDSPKQIASAVKDIMNQSEKVRAVVATAQAMVFEKFDWDLIARDMREKVFARVCGERK